MKLFSKTLLVSGMAALALPLMAAGSQQVTVKIGASELTTASGVARVHQRLNRAAVQVCAQYGGRELARQRVMQRCVDLALAQGVANSHSAALAAFHQRHTGERIASVSLDLPLASVTLPQGD